MKNVLPNYTLYNIQYTCFTSGAIGTYNKLLAMSVVSKKVNYKHAIAILCTTISYDAKCVNVKLIKLSPPINVLMFLAAYIL